MGSSEINLDLEAIRRDLKEYKHRLDNVENYPGLKKHLEGRDSHRRHFRSKDSRAISEMSKEEMESFFSKDMIWSDQRRSTIHFIIEDNGFQKTRDYFALLYRIIEENIHIDDDLWDHLINGLKNVGTAWFTEVLAALDDGHVLFNIFPRKMLSGYGMNGISSDSRKAYFRIIEGCRTIAGIMKEMGFPDPNVYDVDGFSNYMSRKSKSDSEIRYWYYSPGKDASNWPDDLANRRMGIGWNSIGDLSMFNDKKSMSDAIIAAGEGTNASSPWHFIKDMKPDDIVFVRKGMYTIIGVGRITGNYQHVEGLEPYSNIRTVDWTELKDPVETNHRTSRDTISQVSNDDSIRYLLERCNMIQKEEVVPELKQPGSYGVDDLLEDTFLSGEEFERIQNILNRKKNIILKGAPGVGKTYLARRIAYAMMGEKSSERIEFIQFHQNFSYEEFIVGYRPRDEGFVLEQGIFFKFCEKARKDRDKMYFFIIDEINRGNLSKIFGEMLVLIESDKREGSTDGLTLKTAYGEMEFSIPDNVYIIGMMNTADRGLANIDYALRRRFAFFPLVPKFDDPGFSDRLRMESSISPELSEQICDRMTKVNREIARTLDPGFAIGHSFFIRSCDDDDPDFMENDWYDEVIEYEILPLLEEYYFDDPGMVSDLMDILRF